MHAWSLQDATARFSELVNSSIRTGTQLVTRHGEPTVVVMAVSEYERLSSRKGSLAAFLAQAPRVDLNIERSRDHGRSIDL